MKGYKIFNSNYPEIFEGEDIVFYVNLIDAIDAYEEKMEGKLVEIQVYGDITYREGIYYANKVKTIREIPKDENNNYGLNNMGKNNIGNNNRGDNNYGNNNIGDTNFGNNNRGICNSGNDNWGSFNRGNKNRGRGNIGDFNLGDYCFGVFNTLSKEGVYSDTIMFFNKESNWTMEDWNNSEAKRIVDTITLARTKKTKKWWKKLPYYERLIITLTIPNFDKEIFKKITGIQF